jgi:hypothetical protein
MSSLLQLSKKERINKVLKLMRANAINRKDEYPAFYVLSSCEGSKFYNLNLDDLVFNANNEYELWLSVYNYMSKNSSSKSKLKIVNYNPSLNTFDIKIKSKDEDSDVFQLVSDEDILEIINDLIKEENYENSEEDGDNLLLQHVVDKIVEDLFMNDYFWVRKINNYDYESSDDEDI